VENTGIQLDGAPLEKAMQPLLSSLKELQAMLVSLDNTSTGRLTKEMQALKTSAVSAVADAQQAFSSLPAILAKEVSNASQRVNRQMRQAGKDAGEGFNAGMNETMRSQLQERQRWYERMVAMNAKFKAGVLDNLRAQGVNLGPDYKGQSYAEGLRAKSASSVDPRDLLGLPGRDEMKALGSQLAAQMREGVSVEGLRAKSASSVDPRALLGLPGRDEMRGLGSQLAAQMREGVKAEAARAQSASAIDARTLLGLPADRAGKSARGSADVFKEAFEQDKKLEGSARDLGAEKGRLREHQQRLNKTMTDGHGAARGLASSFGALYLTYGSLLPLLAGAAIGNAFTSVVRIGAEVNSTFETIRVLSQESGDSVGRLNKQMLELARSGPFGPREVAAAMKTMSLAGLSAAEVSVGIRDVLNFALAGNTSIKESADVLTSVSTAFKVSVEGYNYVADVIAKAAATSKSSVESIGAAFKTASVINSQYGVSLEDVALGLAALSNVGIQGSAAGTALRNTYADLYGRTEKAGKALAKLGLDARDSAGHIKPVIQIVAELADGLKAYTKRGQDAAIKEIFSERGAKEAIELLSLFQQKAKDANSSATNLLDEMQMKTLQSAAFVITAAAQLSLTPLNQLKSVKATLEATLAESFDVIAPQLLVISGRLKEAFGSEEFKNAVQNLALGFANLTSLLISNGTAIGFLVGAIITYKVAVGTAAFIETLSSGIGSLTTKYASLTAATTAATVATGAGATATAAAGAATAAKVGALSRLAAFLGPIGVGIAAAGTAWQLYSLFANKAAASTLDIAGANGTALLDFYSKEKSRLDELNEALLKNITLEQLRRQKSGQASEAASASASSAAIGAAEESLRKVTQLRDTTAEGLKNRYNTEQLRNLDAQVRAGKEAVALERERADNRSIALQVAKGEVTIAAQLNAELAKNQAALSSAKPVGTKDFDLSKPRPGHGVRDERAALKNIEADYANQFQAIEREEKAQQNLLKFYNDNALITEAQYLAKSEAQSASGAARKAALLERERTEAEAQLLKVAAERAKLPQGGDRWKAADNDLNALDAKLDHIEERIRSAGDSEVERRRASVTHSLKPLTDLVGESEKVIALEDASLQRELAKLKAKTNGNELTERERYIEEGSLRLLEKQSAELVKQKEIREQVARRGVLAQAQDPTSGMSAEQRAAFLAAFAKVDAEILRETQHLGEVGAVVNKAMGEAFDAERVKTFAKELNTKLADAIMNAGRDGGKGLRAWLQDELLRKPFKLVLQAVLDPITKGLSSMLLNLVGLGGGGGAGGAGGIGGIMGAFNSLSSLKSAFSSTGPNLLTNFGQTVGNYVNLAGGQLYDAGFQNVGQFLVENTKALEGAKSAFSDFAQNAGDFAGYLNAAIAFSQGRYLAAAGGALGTVVGGPIGGFIGEKLGDFAQGLLFGGKKSVTSQGFQGTFGSSGFSGSNFQNVHTDGGWLGSDSNDHNLSAMDETMRAGLEGDFSRVKASALSAAAALGISGDAVKDYSKFFSITLGSDAEANKKAVADMFASFSDALAEQLAPGLAEFRRAGETSGAALARLGGSLAAVNVVLGAMHFNLLGVSLAGGSAASSLADVFGGLDKFAAETKTFYDTYFTEAERAANALESMPKVFSDLGLALPTTKEEFRSLVSGLDLSTEAGRKAYATLIKLAPEFATATDAAARFAADTAKTLLSTFTGTLGTLRASGAAAAKKPDAYATMEMKFGTTAAQLASQALLRLGIAGLRAVQPVTWTALTLDAVSSSAVKTSGALGQISAIFLDAASGMIDFGVATSGTAGALTASQGAVQNLNDQLDELRAQADRTRIDFAGLGAALANVDAATFSATLLAVFESLANRIRGVIDQVGGERQALRQAAAQIINPTVMTQDAIRRGISGVNVNAPSNAGVVSAQGALQLADGEVVARQAALTASRASMPSREALDGSLAAVSSATTLVAQAQAAVDQYRAYNHANFNMFMNLAEQGVDVRGSGANGNSAPWGSGESNAQTVVFNLRDARAHLQNTQAMADIQQALYTMYSQPALDAINGAQAAVDQARAQQAAALANARDAQIAYIASLQDFAIDSSKAVGKLTRLREETVKYYEEQKRLADLMGASAAGLRESVANYRFGQLDPQAQFKELQRKYATAYSMALSTDGSVMAGYGDQLKGMLDPLLQAARDSFSTDGEFNAFAATTLARAEAVASRIESLTPTNYAADSLSMLGMIDTTLVGIEASSRTAEKIIADAVAAGADKTANGLRAVIAALTGQTIPGFATGGDFPGGLRIVGENGPELEATGASRIFNASQTRGILNGGSGASNEELVFELRALRAEVADLRIEARATAVNTAKLTRQGERVEVDGVIAIVESDFSAAYTSA
jgi:TP901 family phage tail tape measure protein